MAISADNLQRVRNPSFGEVSEDYVTGRPCGAQWRSRRKGFMPRECGGWPEGFRQGCLEAPDVFWKLLCSLHQRCPWEGAAALSVRWQLFPVSGVRGLLCSSLSSATPCPTAPECGQAASSLVQVQCLSMLPRLALALLHLFSPSGDSSPLPVREALL